MTELAHGVPDLAPGDKGKLNISPRANWVEKRGGLPPYINSIAVALVEKGMTRSRAIATAVNVVKKTCATKHWGGRPNAPVSGAIQAAACSAVARWEAMKVSTSTPTDEKLIVELARLWEAEDSIDLAWNRLRARGIIELARPKPSRARRLLRRIRDLAGPSTAERKRAASKGQAMPGKDGGAPRFPIRNGSDLDKAIRAVGRARPNTEEERRKVRRYVIRRARELGLTSRLPDAWNSDGSLKS